MRRQCAIDLAFEKNSAGKGLSIRDVANSAGVPWSTTRNTLRKQKTKLRNGMGCGIVG